MATALSPLWALDGLATFRCLREGGRVGGKGPCEASGMASMMSMSELQLCLFLRFNLFIWLVHVLCHQHLLHSALLGCNEEPSTINQAGGLWTCCHTLRELPVEGKVGGWWTNDMSTLWRKDPFDSAFQGRHCDTSTNAFIYLVPTQLLVCPLMLWLTCAICTYISQTAALCVLLCIVALCSGQSNSKLIQFLDLAWSL